ncbi:hypothetical protein GCM10009716_20930 [Streptomyces sodiiphilus]|uniref:FXSXX-COOH protein n=1 Tax=Streptomyces sodiiphilus TaxID=226217 RepID=A0ABN2P2N7_9ACTN
MRIIDRATEPTSVPEALSLRPRAMDIQDDLGVDEEARRPSARTDTFSYC